MNYYLKKYWKLNLLVSFFMIAVSLCEVLTSLALMQIFENIINLNMRGFAKWTAINLSIFVLMILFDQIGTVYKGRAIRKMNNCIRLDMAESLAKSDYQTYHASESGEYLSQLTNDINQIENFAWNAFYQCIATVASVIFSILALLSLHWSLTVLAALAAVVLLNAPKLFSKRMENLGAACAEQQANGTSMMKDLLSGYDVLRSFGRMNQFMKNMKEASDLIERPK